MTREKHQSSGLESFTERLSNTKRPEQADYQYACTGQVHFEEIQFAGVT